MKLKILGPPGCGKTSRLMELLEKELADGVPPQRIAFLTFTRAAREEALLRTGKKDADFPYLRTIHAICYRQMNVTQDQVVKPSDLRKFGTFLGVKLNGNQLDPWVEEFERTWDPATRDDLLLQANHCGRHRGILLKESLKNASLSIDYKYAVWFTKAYRAWKKQNSFLDYTDLLTQYLDYGKPLDIDVLFVDEAQDLSSLQWEVVNKLGLRAQRQYVAGDDDQAIFHWAGADATAFQDFAADKTEVLHQSYRVSKEIHAAAMVIVNRIKTRIPKEYSPTDSQGEVVRVSYVSAIDFKHKTFVLFRHHYRGALLSRQLNEMGIPFIGHGSPVSDPDVRHALQCWYLLLKKGEAPSWMVKKLLKYLNDEYTFLNKRIPQDKKSFTIAEIFPRGSHMGTMGHLSIKTSRQRCNS